MKRSAQNNSTNFTSYFKNNPLSVSIQLGGIMVVLLNLWLANKLTPLAQDVSTLTAKVTAVERSVSKHDEYFERLIKVETQVQTITESQLRSEQKLDRLLEVQNAR